MSSVHHDDLAHLKIPLESILSATNNFADKNSIGEAGFVNHYKGQLLWSGELIDIHAQRWSNKEWDDEKEQQFWMEISLLSNLKHKNLASLVGFCDENDEKIIITRYGNRGSLSQYLSDSMLLTWVRRLEISVGLANALSYIHYDEPRDFSVIHRLIDSSRVVLNDDWEPKLSAFEGSIKIEASQRHHSFHTDTLKYTNGYGDPTYLETKSVSHKSDIYSFGIVLFELLCGRKSLSDNQDNKYLAPMAIFHYKEKILDDIIDPDLLKQMDPQSYNVFAKTAYDCLNEERSRRPDISEVVTRLEEALKLQLARENRLEHSIVAAKVESASFNHDKGSVSFISTDVESHLSKKTMSSVKDLSRLKLNAEDILSAPNLHQIRSKEFAHLKVPLENILSATNNFDEENVVFEDSCEQRYKGQLLWSSELIKIDARRFTKKWDDKMKQQFWMEISMLSSLKHKNVVSLVGFCDENDEKIIIIRRETRGCLENYLSDSTRLTWVRRLEISVGLAHALSYIHYDESRDFSVIHRNISSYSVILNKYWEPILWEFQHSMKIKASERHDSFHTDSVWSTKGYTDPAYEETSNVNHKSDIYSFGIVLFELLCGRKSVIDGQDNKYLARAAILHYKEEKLDEIIDCDLWKHMDLQSFKVFAETAYECLNEEQSQRPNMDQIVTRLEKALELQLKRGNILTLKEQSIVEGSSSHIHREVNKFS